MRGVDWIGGRVRNCFTQGNQTPSNSRGRREDGGIPLNGVKQLNQVVDPWAPRNVVHIDSQGRASIVQIGKHTLVAELGIPYRDLRVLDPWVPIPYPTTVFIRERALVLNLECVRMIVCKDQVYVLSVRHRSDLDEVVEEPHLNLPFIKDLCSMLGNPDYDVEKYGRHNESRFTIDWNLPYELRAFEAALLEGVALLDCQVDNLEDLAFPALEQLARKVSAAQLEKIREVKRVMNRMIQKVSKLKKELEKLLEDDMDMMDMYLGKRAEREESVPDTSEDQEDTREDTGNGSNTDTSGTSTARIQASHFGSAPDLLTEDILAQDESEIASIPESAESERKNLLDDSRNPLNEPLIQSQFTRERSHSVTQVERAGSSVLRRRSTRAITSQRSEAFDELGNAQLSASSPRKVDANVMKTNMALVKMLSGASFMGTPDMMTRGKAEWESTGDTAMPGSLHEVPQTVTRTITHVNPREVAGIEALLEAYLMQIDFTMSRLMQLKERIDDTEDLIIIDLDHRRNELHALEILVTSITLMFSFVSMVAGIFGMNLTSGIEHTKGAFIAVAFVSGAVAVCLFVALIVYVRSRRLMFIPDNATLSAPARNTLQAQRRSLYWA